jgi:RNA polymerase sigma-70 factor, ECF subfamily
VRFADASSDEAVRRAQNGDAEAFEALVMRYMPDLYRLAAAIVGEPDAAEATQEALLTAWRELPRLRKPESFLSWARRILANRCRNMLRTRSRRIPAASLDAEGSEPGAAVRDPRRDFRDAVDARIVLDAAFERLSADQRSLLGLHYVGDLSIREAAATLGIPVGTAKSRLNAALAALRAALEDTNA